MIGGLLNATLGNLTELLIALAALRAGQYVLVKASIAGAIVTNALFMLGASFLLGGLKHHVQEYNRNNARLQAGLLFLATIAMLVPSVVAEADATATTAKFTQTLSAGLSGFGVFTQDTWRTLCRRGPRGVRRNMVIGPFIGDAGGCYGAGGPCQ